MERGTAFNGNYISNLLAGKEFKIGRHSLSLDAKIAYAGGRRYTPIDLEASRAAGITVLDETRPFEAQFAPYFRADIKTTFRMNGKRITQEWSVDLQNVSNHQNPFTVRYSRSSDAVVTTYQLGFFPVVQYRILF